MNENLAKKYTNVQGNKRGVVLQKVSKCKEIIRTVLPNGALHFRCHLNFLLLLLEDCEKKRTWIPKNWRVLFACSAFAKLSICLGFSSQSYWSILWALVDEIEETHSPNCAKLISWGNDCSGNQNLLCWIPERTNCVRFYFSVQSIRPGNYCNDKSLERSIDFQCIGHFLGNSRLQRRSLWFECWLITSFVLAECLAIKQRVNDFVFNNNLPMPISTGKSYKMSILMSELVYIAKLEGKNFNF